MSDREVSAATLAAVLPAARVRDAGRGKTLKACDLMSSPVRTCWRDTDLGTVTKLMFDHHCGFIPVIDVSGGVVGVLTDGDIGVARAAHRLLPEQITAAQAMVAPIHGCLPDAGISDVLETMKQFRVRRLPVVDSDRHLHGVISISDILLSVAQRYEPAAMEVISTMAAIGIGKRRERDYRSWRVDSSSSLSHGSMPTPKVG
jgi:CBS domain-containing protein